MAAEEFRVATPSMLGFPSGADLVGLESSCPGAAGRIISMIEDEQKHQHEMVKEELSIARSGQRFALLIALAFLLTAGLLIAAGHNVAGTFIGTVDLVALVTVFVLGRSGRVE